MAFSASEKQFLQSAKVSVVVPQTSRFSLDETFRHDDDNEALSLSDIQQRDTLFFEESLRVWIVVQLPEGPQDQLQSYLSRLELMVEAWATPTANTFIPKVGGSKSSSELIYTQKVKHEVDPTVVVSQSEEDSKPRILLNLIWETTVTVHKPRTRMSDIHVVLVSKATITPLVGEDSETNYLMPFHTDEENIFGGLKGAKGFETKLPFLPTSRLRPVLPQPTKEVHVFQLAGTHTKPIKIFPIGMTRVRHSPSKQYASHPSLMTTLDIDMIPFLGLTGTIKNCQMTLPGGQVKSFMDAFMPMEWRSRDSIALLFELRQTNSIPRVRPTAHSAQLMNTSILVLTISLDVEVSIAEHCKPQIHMEWTTNVDFSQALNLAFGPPSQPLQRSHRPAHLPFGSTDSSIAPSLAPTSQANDDLARAVSVSFSAPVQSVELGVPFSWQVLVVNRSMKTAKLAIIPLPRLQKTSAQAQYHAKRHVVRSSNVSSFPHSSKASNELKSMDVAPAYTDENIVYAVQHSGAVPHETDLVSLTAELRIGPLGPDQCHEGEIRMVAFRKGSLSVDAIRIVDLMREAEDGSGSTGVIVDVRELPDVMVN